MPKNRTFTGGSIIYFQGDVGEDIYVLQQGRVVLTYNTPEGDEEKEEVQAGEFFGIRSSLGRYPREETAQVIGKTTIIQFNSEEFEQFVLKNTRLIIKMLKVFSRQLRNIHREVRDLLKAGAARDPAYELMNVAESFHQSGNLDHAVYAYKKYLELYPGGVYASRANELVVMAQNNRMYPIGYPVLESNPASASDTNPDFDFNEEGNTHQDPGEPYYKTGLGQMQKGNFSGARDSFTKYLKESPTGERVKEVIYLIGSIAEKEGNAEKAKALYHKVATMPPQDNITMQARKRLEGMN